jgi:iron complex outermembrane receptor protein
MGPGALLNSLERAQDKKGSRFNRSGKGSGPYRIRGGFMSVRSILLAATTICGIAVPGLALAQKPAEPAPSASAQESYGDVITVTARRREESLQDTPISVSVLSGDQLARVGVTDAQSLQYQTPSLSITSAQSQRNTVAFSLRGQRTQETQLFTDPPVGTYFAEVVQPRPYGFGNTLFDIQSVQVLKGVQGTLFGRNMTGGAVLVEPHHPELREFSGEIKGQYGNYNMHDIYGMLNIPLGDSVALRFSGKTRERDGWAREVTSGLRYDNQNYDAFRISLLVEPMEGLESLTVLDWYQSNENGTASFLTSISTPSVISNYEGLRAAGRITTNIPAQFAAAQALFQQRRFSLDTGVGEGGNLDAFPGPYEKIKNWGITNKTTWELSDTLTLKNIFGYRKQQRDQVQDYDGIPAFLITPYQFTRTRNISEELQLQGKAFDSRLDFVVGAYYFEEKGIDGSIANTLPELTIVGSGLNAMTTPALLFATANPGEGYSRTAAAFAAGTYKVTDELSVSAGIRYNYDKRKITVSPSRPNLGACTFDIDVNTAGTQTVPFAQCSFTNQKTFKELTYDATIQYEPSNRLTVYGSYRHGFRAGGFSTRATNEVTLRPFLPELVDEFEAGLKTNTPVGSGRLTTSTALFLQNASDVQKQRATAVDTNGDGVPDNVFTIVDNTAKQRNYGGEFEAALTFDAFTLSAFYSYTKVDIRAGQVVLNGRQEFEQRGSPRHQMGATATYSPPIDEALGQVNLIGNVTYRSKIYLDDFEIQGLQPGYALVNARVEWNDIAQSGISAAVFANNLLDKTYRIGVLGLIAEGLGFQNSVYGEPRMYGVEVGFKF